MNKTDKIENLNLNTTELATVLGVSARRVQQLVQDGTIPKASRGKFPIVKAVAAYIEMIASRKPSEAEAKVELDRKTAEARLKAAKASMAELEQAELERKMHRAEDVKVIMEDLVYTIRSALLTLPARLAMDVSHADSPAECQTIIRKEVLEILKELANHEYDPEKFAELVKDRYNKEILKENENEHCED